MNSKLYNVIWVDDEIDSLYSGRGTSAEITREEFQKRGINVYPARDITGFNRMIECYQDRIDAVITDINFSAYGDAEGDEADDTSGFECIREKLNRYQSFGREIPFFVYSGKLDLVKLNRHSHFTGRVFSKDQHISEILDALMQDVNRILSPSFRVRSKYRKELAAAAIIPENEDFLFKELLKIESGDNLKEKICAFNDARQVAERILHGCKRIGLIPKEISKLNKMSAFLSNKNDTYKIKDDCVIMPPPLARSLWYVLDITNDGSHSGSDELNLQMQKYVSESGDKQLFNAILHVLLSLCVWYKDNYYSDREANTSKWYKLGESKVVQSVLFEGVVEEDTHGNYVCGQYKFQRKGNGFLIGKHVTIYDAIENSQPKFKDKYPLLVTDFRVDTDILYEGIVKSAIQYGRTIKICGEYTLPPTFEDGCKVIIYDAKALPVSQTICYIESEPVILKYQAKCLVSEKNINPKTI